MQELELSIMARGDDPAGSIRPLLDHFEAAHHIRVRLTLLNWGTAWTELVKVALYGHGPDVSEIGTTWIGNLISMNALRPFTPAELAGLGGEKAFLASSWQSGSLIEDRDNVCAVPWLADTRLIYYRRSLLEQAGLDAANAFSSPERLAQTLSRLCDSGVAVPWVMPTRTNRIMHEIPSWLWSAGGDFISADGKHVAFDQPQAHAGLKAYFELDRYLVPEARRLDGLQANSFFVQKQAAAMLSTPMAFAPNRHPDSDLVADLGLALAPGIPFVGGSNLGIWKHCGQEWNALKLVNFLTGKQAQTYSTSIGLLPVRLETLTSPQFMSDPFYALQAQSLQAGRSLPAMRFWGLIEDKLAAAFTQLWNEIFDLPAPDIDALLDRNLTPLAKQLNDILSNK